MSVRTANHTFNFQLPSLSYIDAKWEEPNLRALAETAVAPAKIGLVSRLMASYRTWQRSRQARDEFSLMSEYELADIGLSRADVHRVFDPALNQDLQQRGLRS